MKSPKGLIIATVLGILVFGVHLSAAAGNKLVFVDFQKVFDQSKVIQKLNSELQERIRSEQDTIVKKRESLEKSKEELEKKVAVLNPEVRAKKEEELRQELKDLKRFAGDKEEEFQRRGSTLMQDIMKELGAIVKEIGEKKGYAAVVERSTGGVIYFDPSSDITDEVVKEYDKRSKSR
jgi:outer membrane protein